MNYIMAAYRMQWDLSVIIHVPHLFFFMCMQNVWAIAIVDNDMTELYALN